LRVLQCNTSPPVSPKPIIISLRPLANLYPQAQQAQRATDLKINKMQVVGFTFSLKIHSTHTLFTRSQVLLLGDWFNLLGLI